jgi:hypothetical protein
MMQRLQDHVQLALLMPMPTPYDAHCFGHPAVGEMAYIRHIRASKNSKHMAQGFQKLHITTY